MLRPSGDVRCATIYRAQYKAAARGIAFTPPAYGRQDTAENLNDITALLI